MKPNLSAALLSAALLLPLSIRAQDESNLPAPRPDRQQLMEQWRDLSPEERQAKMRELREQGGLPANSVQRPFAGGMGGQPGGEIQRVMMVLTPDQRESLRNANEDQREKTRDLEEKIRAARKAVLEATLDKKFDEAIVRQKLEAATKLEVELTLLRAKALSKIEPPLSEEQIERVKNPPTGEMLRQRAGQNPNGGPSERPFREKARPRPIQDAPHEGGELPPPAKQ